jgi:hypothetical protein
VNLLALLRFWYVPVIIGAYFAGDYHGHAASNALWQAKWSARDLTETRAKDAAIAAQRAQAEAAEKRNADILETLNDRTKERDAAARDLDLARRLLAKAVASAAGSPVPEANRGQAAAPASGAQGDGSLATLVADTIGECRRNADRLDALIAEIEPQIF